MALVYTRMGDDGVEYITHYYVGPHRLSDSYAAQGIEVPDSELVAPTTESWEQAAPVMENGSVVWLVIELPPDDPVQIARRLSSFELPGEHIFDA